MNKPPAGFQHSLFSVPGCKVPAHGRASVLPIVAVAFMLSLSCTKDQGTNNTTMPAITATMYNPGGKTIAAGVLVKFFARQDTGDKSAALFVTDNEGRYWVQDVPDGIYNVYGEKDSLVSFQDSVIVTSAYSTLQSDTLECPSSLTGIVGVEPQHDPRIVTIRVRGAGNLPFSIDRNGRFTLAGLSAGTWPLVIRSTLSDYLTMEKNVTIARCSHTTLIDTLRPIFTGIPVVHGISASQDTLTGAITVSWKKVAYQQLQDYVLYRDPCTAITFSQDFLFAARDTFMTDSSYCPLTIDSLDTAQLCLEYRLAVRNNMQQTGPTYFSIQMPFSPKASVATFFSHHVGYAVQRIDSASINDTVVLSLSARNRTRPLRSCVWYDPVKKDTCSVTINSRPEKELNDTIRYAFDSVGMNRVIAIVADEAGSTWFDTVSVKIVRDAPSVDAGNDTDVLIEDAVSLHCHATQRFGTIAAWEWKIGDGDWTKSAGPDTAIVAPSSEQVVVCSLAAIDDDGNRSADEIKIAVNAKIKSMAAGYRHSLILNTEDVLWACGNNEYGQLGDSTATRRLTPVRIMSNVRSMSAGDNHSLMVKTDNTLWACGSNYYGELGNGMTGRCSLPVQVMTNVQSAAAYGSSSFFLKTDGTLWTCGQINSYLDIDTSENPLMPHLVMSNVQRAAIGYYHCLILKNDNTLWACGYNYHGQLGDGTTENRIRPVPIMTDVLTMSAGNSFSLFLKTDGTLLSCGFNSDGRLGDGTYATRDSPVIVTSDVRTMSAGSTHSLILKTDRTLLACGNNDLGQLGDETILKSSTPLRIAANVQGMAAGDRHSLVVKTDGTLWVCGYNDYGQLGDGTTESRWTLVKITLPRNN